jgi:hypothetical protein
MTHIYDSGIPFGNWYYKNDPTHIFMFQEETFHFVREKFEFHDLKIRDRLITLSV